MFKGLKALLAGLLAGTALGILFAPKKGKDIRQDLKSEIDQGGTGMSTVKDTVVEMGKEIHGTCKDCYTEINKDKGFQEGKKKLGEYAGKAKKEVEKIVKENVSPKTRKKANETFQKAKDVISKIKDKINKKK